MQNQFDKPLPDTSTDISNQTECSPGAIQNPSVIIRRNGTSDSQLGTASKQTKHQHKWLVTNLTFSKKLDVLYADFIAVQARSVSGGYYRSEVGLRSLV